MSEGFSEKFLDIVVGILAIGFVVFALVLASKENSNNKETEALTLQLQATTLELEKAKAMLETKTLDPSIATACLTAFVIYGQGGAASDYTCTYSEGKVDLIGPNYKQGGKKEKLGTLDSAVR